MPDPSPIPWDIVWIGCVLLGCGLLLVFAWDESAPATECLFWFGAVMTSIGAVVMCMTVIINIAVVCGSVLYARHTTQVTSADH